VPRATLHCIGVGIADFVTAARMMEPVAHAVAEPLTMPSMAQGTTSSPSSATMPCNGRTQRRLSVEIDAAPQRCDLGHGKGADDRGDRFAQHVGCLAAGLFDDREIDAVALHQLVLRQPGFAQETFHRLWRRADLWPLGFLGNRLGRNRQTFGNQRQTARAWRR
jgi:hypothetical protein